MKIAYITLMPGSVHGVEKRVHDLSVGALRAGLNNFDFFYLNKQKNNTTGTLKFIKLKERAVPLNYYDLLFRRYRIIEQSVNLDRYDYILLRYPSADPSGIAFTSKYKIITEHHTMEISDYQSYIQGELAPQVRLLKRIRLNLELKYGPRILENVKGVIGVTSEIAFFESNRLNSNIKTTTISNGINVEGVNPTGFKRFNGKNLDMVMLLGSINPWHGLDRVIKSIKDYKGNIKINLHIIGKINYNKLKPLDSGAATIQYHGYKQGHELDEIMKNMNLAISTMALFRKDMEEACSLKTREYVARGIPFILAYNDSDLQYLDKENFFYLQFPNNDSSIPIDRIIDFVGKMSNGDHYKTISECMRSYAFQHLDWSNKMKKYLEFVEGLSAESTKDSF